MLQPSGRKNYSSILFLAWLNIFLVFSSAWAEEDDKSYIQPLNEVFQTETIYPQEKREVQLQLSPAFNEGDKRDLMQMPISIEYGITDFWQFGVAGVTHANRNPDSGPTTRGVGEAIFISNCPLRKILRGLLFYFFRNRPVIIL